MNIMQESVEMESAVEPQEAEIQNQEPTEEDYLLDGLFDEEDGGGKDADLPPARLLTVEVDGQEMEVSEEELKAAYQKNNAANLRFEEANRTRKEAEELKSRYSQSQALMEQAIQQLNQNLLALQAEGEPNWQELLETAPHEYLKQKERFQQRQIAMQQAQQAQAFLVQQQQQEQVAEMKRFLEGERGRLVKDIVPEWKNKAVKEREQNELVQYLTESGYTQEDIVGLSYSRAENIAIVRKAMLYDRAMKKAMDARKTKPEAAQPVPTLGAKGKAQVKRSIDDPNISYDDFVKLRRAQIKNR